MFYTEMLPATVVLATAIRERPGIKLLYTALLLTGDATYWATLILIIAIRG